MNLLFWSSIACTSQVDVPRASSAPSFPARPLALTQTGPGGNVLILVADDVGVDKLDGPANTPNIDGLAADGVRFVNAWALPYCQPTRAALMTGRHARRTGQGSNETVRSSPNELDPGQWTIAEIVAESPIGAYDTSYVGKWHLSSFVSPSGPSAPLVQGWNWFGGVLGNLNVWYGGHPPGDPGYYLWQKVDETGAWAESRDYVTTDNVDEALGRIDAMAEPWVLEVGFTASHGPYDLPPAELVTSDFPTNGGNVRMRTRAIVEALDTEIGRLLAAVPEDTTVIFLGDNGTPHLAVEAGVDPDRSKGSVYEPGIRVPFVVSGPRVGVPGSTSEALVHVVDVLPTVAEIAGVDLSTFPSPTDPSVPVALDGESLLPLIADPDRPARREVLYSEQFSPAGDGPYTVDVRAVRDPRYKLVYDAVSDVEQFFEYPAGGTDEGPDLLPCGLEPEQDAALRRLREAMAALVDDMPFDGPPFADEHGPEGIESPILDDIGCR